MNRAVTVDLWTWSLDGDVAERARLQAFLSEDELARAYRFAFTRDRERFVMGRGRLREILGARVATTPKALTFEYTENGKPSLAGRVTPHFNLSHSGGLAALAVSDDVDLGIDVEEIRPLKEDVAGRFFSKREVERIHALPEAEQLRAFYRCWTRKEAVLKAVGEGLMRPLDSFDVSLEPDVPARVERMAGEADPLRDWRIASFDAGPNFAGAVACRTGGGELTLRRYSALPA